MSDRKKKSKARGGGNRRKSALSQEQTDLRLKNVERFMKIAEMTKAVNLPKDKLRELANLPWLEIKEKLEALALSGGIADGARLLEKTGATQLVMEIELALEGCDERLRRIERELARFKGGLRREDVDQGRKSLTLPLIGHHTCESCVSTLSRGGG